LEQTLAAAGAVLASALPQGAARALKAGAPVMLHRRTRRAALPPPLLNDDDAASFGEESDSGHRSEIYLGSGAWGEWSGDRGSDDVDLYAGDPALAAALARRRFKTASAALALQLSPPAHAAECMPLAATEKISANPAARASLAPPPLSAVPSRLGRSSRATQRLRRRLRRLWRQRLQRPRCLGAVRGRRKLMCCALSSSAQRRRFKA
jgi:hypothetical protein